MEGAWTWILVYVLAFAVFQYVMYRYLQHSEDHVGRAVPEARGAHPQSTDRPTVDDPEIVRCRACGAPNEAVGSYRFCRECLAELP